MKLILIKLCLLVVTMVTFFSCKKMDDSYSKFLKDGADIYVGKVDSVKALAGKNRLQLNWLLTSDPKITKYKVYWNNKADSIENAVQRGPGVDTIKLIVNQLKEGNYNFVIYTYDNKNNTSIAVEKQGVVYGDTYQSSIYNRAVKSVEQINVGQQLKINWYDASQGDVKTEIKYLDNLDNEHIVFVKGSESSITIDGWKRGSDIHFRSYYLPQPDAIDTFVVQNYDSYTLPSVTDVTELYFKNYKQPFTALPSNDRFRILTDWTVNQTVKNHNNQGSFATDDGTVISMESGYGSNEIINGKIFQTFTLPAGDYTFNINLTAIGVCNNVYLAVAKGAQMPDVSALPTDAIAYAGINSRTLNFSLSQAGEVSIGFSGSMSYDSGGGDYWKASSIQLISK